ncbi:Beta-lactamase hydrolase-family protein [Thiorhodococcus drewsii AZ1]|uniref:Beta-lactamase hydrolase-family protein n=1 Tax=Thiorhodococcus drewsii AZ1 TaxID=765913 RepID=G2DVX2_9GAMM|nr:protein tyrosine phosphatase family protein [Thiorhodococcus drewsii]EGV33878.1 Beta-lactamase hydrolase-family protein [Thiorhodococcus drewsii AZ1]
MHIETIKNYRRPSDRIATSGQPEELEFRAIAEAGFEVVVNLAMPNSENAIPEEGYIVTARRMLYVHIPVPFEAPTASHLRSFLGLMDTFADQKVWVHCVVNYRASAFLYQYARLVEGRTHEDALSVMLPTWEPNAVWQAFLALTREDLVAE